MATAALKTFVEDRLLALDPTLDLTPGSPAQSKFISPLLSYLGTDPFETDIDTFLTDRLKQEYPDIYADDPSAVRDLFIKPLILFLEPFKREIQALKRNQSLQDPTLLSDDDADALAANVFAERAQGKFSTGVARVFYANPTNVNVEPTVRFGTAGGLGFVPSQPTSFTAEEMVFNRAGSLYYIDIPARAEAEGSEYNISADQIVSVDGLFGVVRVTNPRKFQNGVDKISTPAFVAQAREALNERSLLNRRGANARLHDAFPGELRAIQVIGARDEEMQRDLLVGRAPGHSWLFGQVTLNGNLAFVAATMVDDAVESAPAPGDVLFVYDASLPQAARNHSFPIVEVVSQKIVGATFQCGWLVRWEGTLPPGLNDLSTYPGGCRRRATLAITSIPGASDVNYAVKDGEVHVFGHSDIYVRPVVGEEAKISLASLVDEEPLRESANLDCSQADALHRVNAHVDLVALGVRPGDVLSIESGDNAGTYIIGAIDGFDALLTTSLVKTASNMRFRISRRISVNPFDPRIPKLPFADQAADDLTTQIGSNLFRFDVNTVDFGVRVGDRIFVKTGLIAGQTFTVTGFDATLGGRGIYVDRSAGGSESNLVYEIYTPLEPIERPLVRIKEVLLLDSAKKSTGITIPPADPVAVVPTSDFTTARILGRSYGASGYVLPAMELVYAGGPGTSPGLPDDRYSSGLDSLEEGYYRTFTFEDGTSAEILIPGDAVTRCSYFMMTVEDDSATESFPPCDPRPGDAIYLKTGPNKGGYIVKKVRKWKYRTGTNPDVKTKWLYFVQIHGTFPVDVIGELIKFFQQHNGGTPAVLGPGEYPIGTLPAYFDQFGDYMSSCLAALGAAAADPVELQKAITALSACEYEWGTPARGTLRTYFSEPTLFQQHTAASATPTRFQFTTPSGTVVEFRTEPDLYPRHEILPARGASDTDVFDYPRDLVNVGGPGMVSLSMEDKPSAFALGIRPDDRMWVHAEVDLVADYPYLRAVFTEANSPRVVLPAGSAFEQRHVGNLLSIEEGEDAGVYRVIEVLDDQNVILDRPLTTSTPPAIDVWNGVNLGIAGGRCYLQRTGFGSTDLVNKWVTFYRTAIDTQGMYVQGSYRIEEYDPGTERLYITANPVWTSAPADDRAVAVFTEAPPSSPVSDSSTSGTLASGTKCYAVRPIRMYQDTPTEVIITAVSDLAGESILTGTPCPLGIRQPYRITRNNIRRVNPLEMSEKQDGPFFYFDTDVVSLTPRAEANISKESYLTIKDGTYESAGYRHEVKDFTRTFSMQEEGVLSLPLRVLPAYAVDRLDNEINLVGAPLQITYERADVVERVQEFVDSAEDRVTAANQLARHFIPAYVTYEASYVGGSSESIVAKDIIEYIDSLSIETPIDVSEIQDLIKRRGGNVITPTKVMLTLHDWDRKTWLELSENELGGTKTKVPYHGTPRVSFYVPGKDRSNETIQVFGERVKLTRL